MSAVDDILQRLPLDQLAARTGFSSTQVETAARAALPALLGGLHANAADPAGEASLTQAVGQHPSLSEGEVDLDAVDAADGDKITRHVFGDQREEVVSKLGGTGADSSLVQKLLPLLAPIVLSYLAKQLGSKAGGSGLGSILSQVIGGAGGGSNKGGLDAGSIITDVLGGLLGGGRR